MEVKSATEQKSLLAVLAPGKRTRLRRLLFEFGPGNGTLLLLPIDQGIEHGPRDFFPNPASKDPEYQFRLAAEAGYSAIACQIGLAEKYYPDYAGQVPLILKVNGSTDVPPSDDALSTTNASVEDAVRLGADAVGYTMYLGCPSRPTTCTSSRACARTATATGCRSSSGPIRAAARIDEQGRARLVLRDRLRGPDGDGDGRRRGQAQHAEARPGEGQGVPRALQRGRLRQQEAIEHCVASAGRSLVVLSGGSKTDDETVVEHTKMIMEAGGSGVIFGRNVWQREWNEALEIIGQIKETCSTTSADSVGPRPLSLDGAKRRDSRLRPQWRRLMAKPGRSARSRSAGGRAVPAARLVAWRRLLLALVVSVAVVSGDEPDGARRPGRAAVDLRAEVARGRSTATRSASASVDGGVERRALHRHGHARVRHARPAGRVLRARGARERNERAGRRPSCDGSTSGAERRDDYGRLLAYVYARGTRSSTRTATGADYARTLAIAPNDARAPLFAPRSRPRRLVTGPGCGAACGEPLC